jgi:hypothetical protein
VEAQNPPDDVRVDELFVLVGTLKILGFESAYLSFRDRLAALKKQG